MKTIFAIFAILIGGSIVLAQSGGIYEVKQTVTGSGGGSATGGVYSLEGTAGQTAADRSSLAPYSVSGGFWDYFLAPTASNVSVSGTVRAPDGRGLRNALVTLTDYTGASRAVPTGSFGFYRFDGIEAGQTIIVSVRSKRFSFETRVLFVAADLAEVDFLPLGSPDLSR